MAFSPGGTGRRKGPAVCPFQRERGRRSPECARRGREGQHIVSREGTRRGGVGREEGGRRSAAARGTRGRRRSTAAARRVAGRGEEGAGPAGGRGERRRHPAARLAPCVRRRHAHTCPPPLPAASLAARAERARLNFPFILGPGGRAGGRARAAVAELSPRALGDARCRPPTRRRVLARDVGAHGRRRRRPLISRRPLVWEPVLRSCRALRAPGGTRAGGPWGAPCGKRERHSEKVPGHFLLD